MAKETDERGPRYTYRGFVVRKTERGWEIENGAGRSGIMGHEFRKVVAVRATRNKAGNFIDRRVFNEQKAKRAA